MRVVYGGGTLCSYRTLQRLTLIADEIAFLDRPSITYGNGGTIGRPSEIRRVDFSGAPIQIHALEPPPERVKPLFERYLEADLANSRFVGTVVEGLRSNDTFRNRFLQDEAKYHGGGTGRQVAQSLVDDPGIVERAMNGIPGSLLPFDTSTPEGRAETLRVVVADASFDVTNVLIQSQQRRTSPVSDDPYFCRLMGLRGYDSRYVQEAPKASPALAVAVAQAVIPDAALEHIELPQLLEYRARSKDAYDAWSAEIDRLAARLEDVPAEKADAEIRAIIASDVRPRLIEYRNAMIATRDAMFAGLLKSAAVQLPTASLAYMVSASPTHALLTFLASFAPAVPALADFIAQREDARRKNSMAYLIGVGDLT